MTANVMLPIKLAGILLLGGFLTQADQQPFSLTIETKNSVARVGEPLHLQVILTNSSHKQLRLAEAPGDPAPAEYQYAIEIRDSNGQLATLTAYGRKFTGSIPPRGSRVTRIIESGESVTDEAVLTKLYDLSRPGKYVVQVTRSVPPYLGKGVVRSNRVTIAINK